MGWSTTTTLGTYYRPSGLPLVSKMPPVSDLYSEQSTSPVPRSDCVARSLRLRRTSGGFAASPPASGWMPRWTTQTASNIGRRIASSPSLSSPRERGSTAAPTAGTPPKSPRRFLPRRCSAATATTFPAPSTCTTPRRRLVRQSPSVCGRATSLQRIEGHSVRAQHSSQRHHVCDGQHGPCTSLRQARAR